MPKKSSKRKRSRSKSKTKKILFGGFESAINKPAVLLYYRENFVNDPRFQIFEIMDDNSLEKGKVPKIF